MVDFKYNPKKEGKKKQLDYKIVHNIPLNKIRGCYCHMDHFYDYMKEQKYNIDKLKEDIKKDGITTNMVLWHVKKEYSHHEYEYFIQDGNHRLRVIKDIVLDQGKKLDSAFVSACVVTKRPSPEDILDILEEIKLDKLKKNKK